MQPSEGLRLVGASAESRNAISGGDRPDGALERFHASTQQLLEVAWVVIRACEGPVPVPFVTFATRPELGKPRRVQVELDVVAAANRLPPLLVHLVCDLGVVRAQPEVLAHLGE